MFFAELGRPTSFSFYDPLFAKGIKIYIKIYIPTSKLPNKTILTVCLLLGSSAKEQFWKLSSGLGFLLTLASICDRSMGIGTKAKSSQIAVKTQLLSSPLILRQVGRELQSVEVGVPCACAHIHVHRVHGLAMLLSSPAFLIHLW